MSRVAWLGDRQKEKRTSTLLTEAAFLPLILLQLCERTFHRSSSFHTRSTRVLNSVRGPSSARRAASMMYALMTLWLTKSAVPSGQDWPWSWTSGVATLFFRVS